jgi:hypothetical protein
VAGSLLREQTLSGHNAEEAVAGLKPLPDLAELYVYA